MASGTQNARQCKEDKIYDFLQSTTWSQHAVETSDRKINDINIKKCILLNFLEWSQDKVLPAINILRLSRMKCQKLIDILSS